jgi:hypothetical protein
MSLPTPLVITNMPAYLLLGSHEQLIPFITTSLQNALCPHEGCGACAHCRGIAQQQHHGVTWLLPEKYYTRDEILPIMERMALQLDDNEHHFFILQKADLLTIATANNLLKVVEEPPRGYHFIFLAEVKDALPQTIVSRCVVHTVGSHTRSSNAQALFDALTALIPCSPVNFQKLVEQGKYTEPQSLALVNDLLHYCIEEQRQALTARMPTTRIEKRINLLQRYIITPPMPGSSKILWQTLFTQWSLIDQGYTYKS